MFFINGKYLKYLLSDDEILPPSPSRRGSGLFIVRPTVRAFRLDACRTTAVCKEHINDHTFRLGILYNLLCRSWEEGGETHRHFRCALAIFRPQTLGNQLSGNLNEICLLHAGESSTLR